ncbi:glycoside hydrolase family 31 protein [Virgibacillus siamensis]|uniref:Glycoside hydrolase family 31 protein n=1 Tax=Virgibacillus siamensis TaxID=480071 RepID=A0ABN1GEG4_9BACI
MQDTSFAIHPGNKKQPGKSAFQDIGKLITFKNEQDKFIFHCENGYVTILCYSRDIVRIVMNPTDEPVLDRSFTVKNADGFKAVDVHEGAEQLELLTNDIRMVIHKTPFRLSIYDQHDQLLVAELEKGMGYDNEGKVMCYKAATEDDHYYGFGEKSGFLNKQGEKLTMWNSDVYAPHNPETDSLYESIPFFMTLTNGRATGIFLDNTFQTTFDMRTEQTGVYSMQADGGQLDYYFFAGPTPKQVIAQYTGLTGRMPLPPKWAIGYHQSRYSYETEVEVRELVRHFQDKQIPLDAVHLDIHHMDGYRVFTFDADRFPNPDQLIAELKEQGIRIVPIVDPGVKADSEYSIYQEGILHDLFCKYMEGNVYFGDVWPGKSAFPDFTKKRVRNWWGEEHQFYTDKGIEGIWNDMNEPAVFNETKTMDVRVMHDNDGNPKFHRELHNVYGNLMGRATYHGMKHLLNGKRPFLLTRAGYAGVQKYAAVWTGDNRSFWEHLEMAIPMCLNLGVSGVPFSGPDVGGFAHDSNGELLTRWTQFGAFTPFFRNHSAIEAVRQEPWSFGEKYEPIIKQYIQLRYKWLQHLYKLFKTSGETGIPLMRPLFLEYPEDKKTYQLSDQFLIGDNVLIAPILRPGVTDRIVYLPAGEWYDYWTDEKYDGGQKIMVHAELDTLPIFIKKGTVLPEAEITMSTAKPISNMTIHIYPDESTSTYQLYDDDGQTFAYEANAYFALNIHARSASASVVIDTVLENDGYKPGWTNLLFKVHGLTSDANITYNEKKVNGDFDAETCTLVFSGSW